MCTVVIPNAQVTPSRTTKVGETATVNCNPVYTVNGNNPITCNADKQFSTIPTCEPDCTADNWGTLGIAHSVTPAKLPVPYLTELTVQCVEKYSTMTNTAMKCGVNGQFTYTGEKPTCYAGL